jgi:hypothetical protein
MFRKPLVKSSEHPLKGSERKKAIAQLQARFPLLSDSQLTSIFPKSDTLTSLKLPDWVCTVI